MKINAKEVLMRALKTFWQAAIPVAVAALSGIDYSGEGSVVKTAIIAALISTAAAGLSAIYNSVVKPILTSEIKADESEFDLTCGGDGDA